MKKTCIGCSRFSRYKCGKVVAQRMTSGAVRYMAVPDERCKNKD